MRSASSGLWKPMLFSAAMKSQRNWALRCSRRASSSAPASNAGSLAVSVIAWMAGMFYLPRLLVYHTDVPKGSESSELFKVMERRLLRVIINPAMIFSCVFGLWLAWSGFGLMGGWLHVKIAAVLGLSAFHGYLSKSVRDFAADRNTKSSRHWRMMNEVPTLLMVVIVILVILKPF